MIALVAYFLNPANVAFSALPLPEWLRWTGVGLGCRTLCLLFWTLRTLGKNLTDTVVTRQHHTLVPLALTVGSDIRSTFAAFWCP